MLLAVLGGALFLDRSQRLVPVYAAARDLPAGSSLREGDLVAIRVRLPATALRHYLQPSPDRRVAGRVLTAPVRRDTLVPAGIVLASSLEAHLVELPLQVDPGDMAQGLRPGDRVQVLAAYTEGARRGQAVVLLPTAEVIQVLADPAGLTGAGQERGVQLRMPSDRAPIVVAAIATARIFVIKAPGLPPEPAGTEPVVPGSDESGSTDPGPVDPGPVDPGPADPGPVDPGSVDPAPRYPAPGAPGSSAPGSGAAGSGAPGSGAPGSGAAGSGAPGSGDAAADEDAVPSDPGGVGLMWEAVTA